MKDPGLPHVHEMIEKIAYISQSKVNLEKRMLWENLWLLKADRPLVLARAYHYNQWMDERTASCDPFLKSIELQLLRKLAKDGMQDDEIMEPFITIDAVFQDGTSDDSMFGLPFQRLRTPGGISHGFIPQIFSVDDLNRLHMPDPFIDEKATSLLFEKAQDAVDGKLGIRVNTIRPWMLNWINPAFIAIYYIGFQEMLYALVEDPEFLHSVMDFFSSCFDRYLTEAQSLGYLPPANRVTSNSIPHPFSMYDAKSPAKSLLQLVARGDSQEFALVSPEQTEEFLLAYQRPIFNRFMFTHYGCCECFHRKWDLLKSIPNLRLYAVSPYTNLEEAVGEMGDGYAIDWRVNVANVISGQNQIAMRKEVEEGVRVSKGKNIAVVLQDVETLNGNKNLIHEWVQAAKAGIGM